jgi:hypothetical protein
MKPHSQVIRVAYMVACVVLAIAPGRANAGPGLALAWNQCFGDAGFAQNANFACNSNTGTHVMVGTFTLASDMPKVTSMEIIIDVATASAALPEWWRFHKPGSNSECRETSLSVNFVLDPAATCVDWALGQQVGGVITCPTGGPCVDSPKSPNATRIKLPVAVSILLGQNLTGGVAYFAFNVVMNNAKTVGAVSCAGCSVPACIVLNSINVYDENSVNRFISQPAAPGSNYVTWQGGGGVVVGDKIGCPAATATRNSTWGSVKSLYR